MLVSVAVNGQLQSEIVTTQSGRIRGYVADPSVPTLQFLGIPYAKPPIGMTFDSNQFRLPILFLFQRKDIPVVKYLFQPSSHSRM